MLRNNFAALEFLKFCIEALEHSPEDCERMDFSDSYSQIPESLSVLSQIKDFYLIFLIPLSLSGVFFLLLCFFDNTAAP